MDRSGLGEVVIRKATRDDAEIVADAGRVTFSEAFGDTNTAEDLKNYLQKSFNVNDIRSQLEGPDIFYVAQINGGCAGYMKLNVTATVPEVEGHNAVQLERIYVRKHLYRMGVGKRLLDAAIDEAKASGFDHLWLGVWQENERAIDFYIKHNFKIAGTKLFRIGDNITKDFVMLLKI
jgi:ribosomal protein S18 acetylase RimI-like enzyme